MSEKEELVIYPSIFKTFVLSILSIIMTASSFLIITFRKNDIPMIVIGIIGTLFFGACSLYIIYRLFVRKPSLVIDSRGIYDNASAIGVGLIEWNEIKDTLVYNFMGQKFLGIIPYDIETVLSRVGTIKRAISKINKGMVIAPINIPQNTIRMPLEEVKRNIDYYMAIKR